MRFLAFCVCYDSHSQQRNNEYTFIGISMGDAFKKKVRRTIISMGDALKKVRRTIISMGDAV